MDYSELKEALRVLGLGERVTLQDIKARHRKLVKLHHPDTNAESEPEAIRQINSAYRIILDYISEYRFSFSENEFYEQNSEERIKNQFVDFYYS